MWYCYFFKHTWKYSLGGQRRACIKCHRREVMTFRSRRMTSWKEHTYPLDADPSKDPTPICIDDFVTTLGVQHSFKEIERA